MINNPFPALVSIILALVFYLWKLPRALRRRAGQPYAVARWITTIQAGGVLIAGMLLLDYLFPQGVNP